MRKRYIYFRCECGRYKRCDLRTYGGNDDPVCSNCGTAMYQVARDDIPKRKTMRNERSEMTR